MFDAGRRRFSRGFGRGSSHHAARADQTEDGVCCSPSGPPGMANEVGYRWWMVPERAVIDVMARRSADGQTLEASRGFQVFGFARQREASTSCWSPLAEGARGSRAFRATGTTGRSKAPTGCASA
jgi:hypothetical protein